MRRILFSFLLVQSTLAGFGQNYDVATDIIERNPSYILEDYFEIVQNESNQHELVHIVKSVLNGSVIETKTYYAGTPYYKNLEWHKASVTMPGQKAIDGFLSFNMVYQQVYFKTMPASPARISIEPEFFNVDGETFYSFAENKYLPPGYYSKIDYPLTTLLQRRDKLELHSFSNEINGYEVGQGKYEGAFVERPDFYIIEQEMTLKVDNKSSFFKQFAKDKKKSKVFVKSNKIDFYKEEDIKKLLDFLLKKT